MTDRRKKRIDDGLYFQTRVNNLETSKIYISAFIITYKKIRKIISKKKNKERRQPIKILRSY